MRAIFAVIFISRNIHPSKKTTIRNVALIHVHVYNDIHTCMYGVNSCIAQCISTMGGACQLNVNKVQVFNVVMCLCVHVHVCLLSSFFYFFLSPVHCGALYTCTCTNVSDCSCTYRKPLFWRTELRRRLTSPPAIRFIWQVVPWDAGWQVFFDAYSIYTYMYRYTHTYYV